MRKIHLSKSGLNKLKSYAKELKESDFEGSIKSIPPGEWCFLYSPSHPEGWVAFLNPLVDEKFSCAQVVGNIKLNEAELLAPEEFIKNKIKMALKKRSLFQGYEEGGRLFYGFSDGLPGLIIDVFFDASIIQINTAGIDKYREEIKKEVEAITKRPVFLLDNPKYREKECLPTYETSALPNISVRENGLSYNLRSEVIQKVGFYYDHRENRAQLFQLLHRLKRMPQNGLDLFCYAGAWGMSALHAGVECVMFIDQGDFEKEINQGLDLNGFSGRGKFKRIDVFKYLDEAIANKIQHDLILCDPPAFAKSAQQKQSALEGYTKLHRKVFKVASSGALCVFSSCTHYVSHDEFQKNILDVAYKEGKNIQLIYSGIQGWDHPIQSQADKANYIKSYFYILE